MIKVTYYVGTYDKNTCERELLYCQFVKCFDKLFTNYTLQNAQGVYTMKNTGIVVKEFTFIVTTFIEEDNNKDVNKTVLDNVQILKDKLNQESILVEVTKPEAMFL